MGEAVQALQHDAGRVCPLDYRTDPADLARAPDVTAETLYVVGGLYGNPLALDAIEALADVEPRPATVIFNGDAHWFDADAALFRQLDRRLARYAAIRGNIEAELARVADAVAGCGCAYPPEIADAVVERSNAILARLRTVAGTAETARFAALPATLVAQVGSSRVGIVHGDPSAIAGWRFSRGNLDAAAAAPWLDAVKQASRIDIFASTHTCAAVMRDFALPSGSMLVANNGAAGMGNFRGETSGLLTRISVRRSPHAPRYGAVFGGTFVDAIPIAFDAPAFLQVFDGIWPGGSPAALSYRARIAGDADGPAPEDAAPTRGR